MTPEQIAEIVAQRDELLATLKQIAAIGPAEQPDIRDDGGRWYSLGNYDDVAYDAAREAEWHIAEIARTAIARAGAA